MNILESIDQNLQRSGITTIPFSSKFMFGAHMGKQFAEDILPDIVAILEDPDSENYEYSLAGQIRNGRQVKINASQFTPRIVQLKTAIDTIAYSYVERWFAKAYAGQKRFEGRVELHDMWIVEQKENDYNPIHTHATPSPAGLSGVVYLQVPDQIGMPTGGGKAIQDVDGQIQVIYGTTAMPDPTTFTTHETIVIPPEPGRLLMFTRETTHQVYPFQGSGSRICIAFNVSVWF